MPQQFIHRSAKLLSTTALLAAVATSANAQQQSTGASQAAQPRLQGVVAVEETLQPVPGAIVEIMDQEISTETSRWGDFALADAPVGTVWVRVSAPGHPSVREEIEITEDGVVFVQFLLPQVNAVLSELLVSAQAPMGEAARSQARSAFDLLAIQVPSVSGWTSGNVGETDFGVRLRGYNSLLGNTQPLVVIDGVATTSTQVHEILAHISADEVETIEVLRGPSAAFLYPESANGVIHVRTKR